MLLDAMAAELLGAVPAVGRAAVSAALAHPLVDRLRRVAQCGAVPALRAVTRYDHSVGTATLAARAARASGATAREATAVALAGLLHDAGHGPYSHAFDEQYEPAEPLPVHEHRGARLAADVLAETAPGLVAWVQHCIAPDAFPCPDARRAFLGEIVANHRHGIDVDKLDYVRRDATAAHLEAAAPYDAAATAEAAYVDADGHWNHARAADVALVLHARQMLHDDVYSCPAACAVHAAVGELLAELDAVRAADACVPPRARCGFRRSVRHAAADARWWAGFDDNFVGRVAGSAAPECARAAALARGILHAEGALRRGCACCAARAGAPRELGHGGGAGAQRPAARLVGGAGGWACGRGLAPAA